MSVIEMHRSISAFTATFDAIISDSDIACGNSAHVWTFLASMPPGRIKKECSCDLVMIAPAYNCDLVQNFSLWKNAMSTLDPPKL